MKDIKPQYKEFFKTLGNETRINILLCLERDGECSVSRIVKALDVDQSTVSHNLKRLEKCSFVEVRPSGKERLYSLNKKTIKPLFAIIEKHSQKYCKNFCCK